MSGQLGGCFIGRIDARLRPGKLFVMSDHLAFNFFGFGGDASGPIAIAALVIVTLAFIFRPRRRQ